VRGLRVLPLSYRQSPSPYQTAAVASLRYGTAGGCGPLRGRASRVAAARPHVKSFTMPSQLAGETDLADLWVRAAELMERLFRYAQGDGQDQVLLPDGDGSGSLFGQLGEVEGGSA